MHNPRDVRLGVRAGSSENQKMGYTSIYAYAWDLAEAGVSGAIDRFLALGLDTVTVAGSYHAGKFLRPNGQSGKVYFPEDGAVYFKPEPERYGAIKPISHSMIALGEDMVGALAAQDRIATNVWLVLLHNTRLGAAYPQATVANAFGDRYIYNLCPSAPEARAYAVGLALDVTESYPVSGAGGSHPRALAEPYVTLSRHTAPIVRPRTALPDPQGSSHRWLTLVSG